MLLHTSRTGDHRNELRRHSLYDLTNPYVRTNISLLGVLILYLSFPPTLGSSLIRYRNVRDSLQPSIL